MMSGSPPNVGARSPPMSGSSRPPKPASLSPPKQPPIQGLWDHLASNDPNDTDMRDNPTIAAHRTAARTGTTFDMADLLTNGTATKLPGMYLPQEHPAMQVIALNEMTMPGDVLGVSPRHPPSTVEVKQRMAQILRERSLDIVNLMDDFLKRPAYSRMPTRNRAFLDVQTFRRALCYAFGDQWTRLSMSTNEFNNICKEYVRADNTFYDKDKGVDVQGFGQPEPLILWQPFAYEVQKLSDGGKYDIALRGAMSKEQQALYDQSVADAKAAEEEYAARSALDIGKAGTGHLTSNTGEALERLRVSQLEKKREEARPIGVRGATVGQVRPLRTKKRKEEDAPCRSPKPQP